MKQKQNLLSTEREAAGSDCISGSLTYFITTGISHFQARKVLSSEVDTNRLPSSRKVIVLTAPIC